MPQKIEIDPILFTSELKNTFRRYLYTANMTSDSEPRLQDRFWTELDAPDRIINGPLIHCIPCYKQVQTLKQVIEAHGSPAVSRKFLRLPQDQFDPTRPLYSHQLEALRLMEQGHNLVVATGTGSGKTECFLLPILQSIFADPTAGLRAILIYPMNALANDQLDRLRRLLRECPEVTFGRYTSDTPRSAFADEKAKAGAIANERYSREEIWASPPHILLTNFAMMEYLLLRPRDAELFKQNRLKFIVLDEAHTYGGSQGIEIAYLMRRLRQYLAKPPATVQFVLTSATIGTGPQASEKTLAFANDLTGASFETEDLLKGEIVHSFSNTLQDLPTVATLRSLVTSDTAFDTWTAALANSDELCKLLKSAGLSTIEPGIRAAARILFDLLCHSKLLATLHELCQDQPLDIPTLLDKLALSNDDIGRRCLSWLIALGSSARPGPDSAPLLPVRLHFFCRGLVGATLCLNPECQGKQSAPADQWSCFFLENRKQCQFCEKAVLPLSTCVHCGLPVMKVHVRDNKWQTSADTQGQSRRVLLTWANDIAEDDEEDTPSATICLACRSYSEEAGDTQCCASPIRRELFRIPTNDPDGSLSRCPRCEGGTGDYPTVLREFTTGEEAPTAVLNEVIIRQIPFDPGKSKLPANGRNLLVFSDSRQRAAFFAPYLKQTMAETAYLGPIHDAIRKAGQREHRPVALDEIADQYLRDLSPTTAPVAVVRERNDAGLEHFELKRTASLTAAEKTKVKREVKISLLRHICFSTKQRSTMPGLGLAALAFDMPDDLVESLCAQLPVLSARGKDFTRQLLESLLTLMVQRAAVDPPEMITAGDVLRYGPNTPEAYTFHLANAGRVDRRLVIRWNPYACSSRGRKNSINRSRHLAVVSKTLCFDKFKDEAQLTETLIKIWDALRQDMLVETPTWPGEYRVNYDRLQLTTHANWLCCSACGRLNTNHILGVCQSSDCSGTPEQMEGSAIAKRFDRNHYRNRYLLSPLPLEVKEHTAQLTNEVGRQYQEQFIRGEVNVLSSSTTFEMGVDVGGLKAVLLRNVPPKSSNYVQRAGRAGRRRDGISLAVTFARNVPHDQHHFQTPSGIIQGKMPVPYINVSNNVLAQRHVNSLLLGYFLRSLPQAEFEEGVLDRTTLEQFFLDYSPGGATLCERFAAWATSDSEKPRLSKVIREILAGLLKDNASPMLDESVRALASEDPTSVLSADVRAPLKKYEDQLKALADQLPTVTGNQRRAIANAMSSLERLTGQFKAQKLIDFLSSASWLPGYAFPQDIVKLVVRHVELEDRMRLERDREIGIAEYAPGSEIVADGHLLRSGAIWFNSREPDIRWYTRCPNCRKISTYLEPENPGVSCDRCGTAITGRNSPKRYLKPDAFSTIYSDPPEEPGMFRRRPPRNSEVFLLEGANPDEFKKHSIPGVTYGAKCGGRMFRANSGYSFAGFLVCRRCGRWFENRPKGPRHEAPWGGNCGGTLTSLHLAHELVTDVLQLRFNGCMPPAPKLQDRPFWLSFEASFLHGCTDALGIEPNDLGGTYNGWTDGSWVGELVIYDRVPGGAGHINRIVENLDQVLQAALARVRDCKCGDIASSCYACLRTYNNQLHWGELQRQPVIQWLSAILGAP